MLTTEDEARIEYLLKQLELLIRGKRIDEDAFLHASKELFIWSSSPDTRLSAESLSEDVKLKFLNTTVQLYNKSRSLVQQSVQRAKLFVKAASAWMISIFNQNKYKSIVMCIKLHTRSSTEFLHTSPVEHEYALLGFNEAIRCWGIINEQHIERILPPVELDELRLMMFHTYLDKSKLLKELYPNKLDDIRLSLGGAMELVNFIPEVIFQYVQYVIDIAHHMAQYDCISEALHYFKISHHILQGHSINKQKQNVGDGNVAASISKADIDSLMSKTLLGLAYSYKELNQCEKALSCIEELNNGSFNIPKETLLFAKFTTLVKSGDIVDAGNVLQQLLHIDGLSYETALNCVLLYMDNASNPCNISSQYFHLLAVQYPMDPYFTQTRIVHLQLMLSHLMQPEKMLSVDTTLKSAMDVCRVIILDHQQTLHPLDDENYSNLVHLLMERIAWHRSSEEWNSVISWIDILQGCIKKDDISTIVIINLWKVDALIHIYKYEDAFTISTQTVSLSRNTKTMLVFFHAALMCKSPLEATKIFLDLIRLPLDVSLNDNSISAQSDHLEMLLMACKVVKESKTSQNIDAVILTLLQEWLYQYDSRKIWRGVQLQVLNKERKNDEFEGGNNVISYLSVLCEACQTFIGSAMQVVAPVSNCLVPSEISKDGIIIMSPTNNEARNVHFLSEHKDVDMNVDKDESIDHMDVAHAAEDYIVSEKENTGNMMEIEASTDRIISTRNVEKSPTSWGLHPFGLKSFDQDTIQQEEKRWDNAENLPVVYEILCNISEVKSNLLDKVEAFITLWYEKISREGYDISVMGSYSDIIWLADMAWNFGILLMEKNRCILSCDKFSSNENTNNELKHLYADINRYFLASEFLVSAQRLYSLANPGSSIQRDGFKLNIALQNEILCLLLSASIRLDVDALISNAIACVKRTSTLQNEGILDESIITCNMNAVSEQLSHVDTLVRQIMGLGNANKSSSQLNITSLYVILVLTVMCRVGKGDVVQFVEDNMHIFMDMSFEEIQKCEAVCMDERGGSSPAARLVLQYGIQGFMKQEFPNYAAIGSFYRKLINLSPTRQKALEIVQDFEQILYITKVPNCILPEDIDAVCAMCYNWGVTLLELNQQVLSEKFIAKSLSLYKYTSPDFSKWHESIQDAYVCVLKAKVGKSHDIINKTFGEQLEANKCNEAESSLSGGNRVDSVLTINNLT